LDILKILLFAPVSIIANYQPQKLSNTNRTTKSI